MAALIALPEAIDIAAISKTALPSGDAFI